MSKNEKVTTTQIAVSSGEVSKRIYTLRGCQVMLDSDLARIYQVETKSLKRAVKRNIERFPKDFMFEPNTKELEILRYQFGTSSVGNFSEADARLNLRSQIGTSSFQNDSNAHGGSRYVPFVFTEPGVAMLSSVLHSERAIQVNIEIMRVFIQLRRQPEAQGTQLELLPKIETLERQIDLLKQRFDQFEKKSQKLSKEPPSNLLQGDKVRLIQSVVAKRWGVRLEDLKSATRTKAISLPRHVAIYLVRKHICMGFSEIGQHFGRRDHSTIMHAYHKVCATSRDKVLQHAIDALQIELQPLLA